MRQVRRPPQAVPRTRPASYRRYAVALGAAASGFMALLVIYGSVSLREGVVGVQDLAPGASSYENAQWSKELSKTELKKETDDEVACCPSLAVSVHINRCLRLIRRLAYGLRGSDAINVPVTALAVHGPSSSVYCRITRHCWTCEDAVGTESLASAKATPSTFL